MSRTRVRRSERPAPAEEGEGRFRSMLADVRERHDEALGRYLARKRDDMPGRGESRVLVDVLEELVRSGGKRLRPALTCFAYRAFGGRSDDRVLPLAMSTELLHTYLLIHDDIMDRSELRRGEPTAHEKFRRRHSGRELPGDAEHFGRSGAILAGDLAHTWAVELFQSIPTAENGRGRDLEEAFSAMCAEVISGQYLEIVLPQGEYDDVSEDDLLEILRLKSGRYSVERPVQLGSLLAGGGPEGTEPLRAYSRPLGEAFQLQDDILGSVGNADRAGKPGGLDLIEGKLTVLVHHALRASPPEDRRRLLRTLEDPDPDEAEVREAQAIVRRSGALGRVEDMIRRRLDRAEAAVEEAPIDEDARTFFTGLVHYLRGRER